MQKTTANADADGHAVGQPCEEILDRPVEQRRLVQVGGMPGIADCHRRGARDLARHVIGRREKMRIVGADQHQGRYGDRVEPGDDAIVGLGQHAACGAGQAPRRAMPARANLGALAECGKPLRLKVPGALLGSLVPGVASLAIAEIRPVSNSINAATSSGWTRWKASDM